MPTPPSTRVLRLPSLYSCWYILPPRCTSASSMVLKRVHNSPPRRADRGHLVAVLVELATGVPRSSPPPGRCGHPWRACPRGCRGRCLHPDAVGGGDAHLPRCRNGRPGPHRWSEAVLDQHFSGLQCLRHVRGRDWSGRPGLRVCKSGCPSNNCAAKDAGCEIASSAV